MQPDEPVWHPECFEMSHGLPRGATRAHTVKADVRETAPNGPTRGLICAGCGRPISYQTPYTNELLMSDWSSQDAVQ